MGLTYGHRDHPWHRPWHRPRRPWFSRDPYVDYDRTGYLAGVRHFWPCLIVVTLLLAAYEVGVARLKTPDEPLRAGVELWLRQWLADAGGWPPVILPAIIVGLLLVGTMWRWRERPERLFTCVFGICLESMLFGLVLWTVCLNAPIIFDHIGLTTAAVGGPNPKLISYLGVGIYEEVIFRLIGFAWLAWLLRTALVPRVAAIPMAMIVSSAVFALAHHFVQTDPFVPSVFLTRVLIGLYCAVLYWLRGLGVAIGAHVVYDIVVATPTN